MLTFILTWYFERRYRLLKELFSTLRLRGVVKKCEFPSYEVPIMFRNSAGFPNSILLEIVQFFALFFKRVLKIRNSAFFSAVTKLWGLIISQTLSLWFLCESMRAHVFDVPILILSTFFQWLILAVVLTWNRKSVVFLVSNSPSLLQLWQQHQAGCPLA